MTTERCPVRADPSVTNLMARAKKGDKQAWDALVDRYAPLIWSICRRYQLGRADANDVGQRVWLQLADQLPTAADPATIPGWLAATTQRECDPVRRAAHGPHAAEHVMDARNNPGGQAEIAEQELLLAERNAALREAFTHLPPSCQQLMTLLAEDPPVPYAEISAKLSIPVEDIELNRAHCLDKLRRHPAIAALINADPRARSVLLW